jgi:8-oxo-dGTP diphosphatase
MSTVFTAAGSGELRGGDDAAQARVFTPDALPSEMAFDHRGIIADYVDGRWREPPRRG